MRNSGTGFSLLEIMITVILIAIVAVSAFAFLVYCGHFTAQTDAKMTAANFARETMEDLYMINYNSLPSNGSPALPTGSRLHDSYNGTRIYAVTDKADYKMIAVTVSWSQ